MYRTKRTFFSLARALHGPRKSRLPNGQISVQRVRIVRPIFTWKGVLKSVAVCATPFLALTVLELVVTLASDDGDEHEDEDEDEHEDGSNSIFLPLGFVKEQPAASYESSDPIWQSFGKLLKDQEKIKHLRSKNSMSGS